MDRTMLLDVKLIISLCPLSIITRQWASVDELLHRPRNVGYYHIFER